jgi:6-phosphogluconolactonase
MACEALLSKVPVPSTNIHRIRGEDPDAGKIAADYEREIRRFFKIEIGEVPRFNCVLLGMGSDGHTASLFPGTPALRESNHLVVANWVPKFNSFRITLTAPVLNNAECILFLVSGDEKADILKTVLEGPRAPVRYPAQLVQPKHGSVEWYLDRSAAKRLVSVQHG